MKVLSYPACHRDEVASLIEWGCADAICIISMVTAVLNRRTSRND